jgi:hypothetical protein
VSGLSKRFSIAITSDVFCSDGDVDVEQLLYGEGEALLVAHHRNIVETIEIGQGLKNWHRHFFNFKAE